MTPHWQAACDVRRRWAKRRVWSDYDEAMRRFSTGVAPHHPPGGEGDVSLIATHLADVVDERIFEEVWADIMAGKGE